MHEETAATIRRLYSDALLSARLRGVEGVPAKRAAIEATIEGMATLHDKSVTREAVERCVNFRETAPFSMVMATAPKAIWDSRDHEPIMDERMTDLLRQLHDAVHETAPPDGHARSMHGG